MRFLGVDLAWKDGNPSGLALLGGQRFPLHLRETPHTLTDHEAVLGWIARHVAHHRASVGIDAPLLGLARDGGGSRKNGGSGGGRRGCDNEVSSVFWRFHASTHSPPGYPGLADFTRALMADYPLESFGPDWRPTSRRPAIREVYPNALQVLLFGLDRRQGSTIIKYKQRIFGHKQAWVEQGLGPFVKQCIETIGGRYVVTRDAAWQALVAERPRASMTGSQIKSIEDRWDAVLCALGAALEFYAPGSMRFYPDAAGEWRRGYILAPTLPTRSVSA